AKALYEQSLEIFRQLGDRWGVASLLADLGNLARDQEDYDGAHALYGQSVHIFRELDHKRGVARLLECFAFAASAQLRKERSLRLAGAAAALRHLLGAPLSASEQAEFDTYIDPARQSLAKTAGAEAWTEGWSMPTPQAIEYALERDSVGQPEAV